MMQPLPRASMRRPASWQVSGAADHLGVEGGADVGQRPILGRAGFGLAGDVAEDVDAAEFAIDGGEDLVEMVGVGDVAGDREGFAAELGDGVGGGLDAGFGAVEQDEVGAGFGEGDGAAHALGASGDDRDAVVEVEEGHWGSRGAGCGLVRAGGSRSTCAAYQTACRSHQVRCWRRRCGRYTTPMPVLHRIL